MPDYTDQSKVLILFEAAKDVETDNREMSRDDNRFIDDPAGQWESDVFSSADNKPRYTFDRTTPIVEQIAGEIEQADFDIRIKPAGGDATKDDAKLLDGMVRNIENISDASHIFNNAARSMVKSGIGGWRVKRAYLDDNSFDQDLIISPILDFANRVWFDPNSKEQNKSDSRYCFLIQPISPDEFKEKFPDFDGAPVSVTDTKTNTDFGYSNDDVFLGQIYYKKEETRELLLMTDGQVLVNDDDFKDIEDELAERGITVKNRRKRPNTIIMSRLFDANGWIVDEEETVFNYIPVIPVYGNYTIDCNKTRYRGVVRKLKDTQRVMNYSMSREIEEGALAPRAKIWMTQKQAAGHESQIQTLNTNSDPVQFYNWDSDAPGIPQQTGGAQINPGLRTMSQDMSQSLNMTAGLFAANMGDNPGLQSGVAIERLQNKGDTGTVSYFSSMEVAICHTGRIIIDALPRVYDTERMVRVMQEDGSFDITTINQEVTDRETGRRVVVNDLSKGQYDVTCSAGPSFQNRQQEAVTGIIDAARVNPSIMEIGSDIFMKNQMFPGAEQIAERMREQLFNAGVIPFEQMTDEEKQKVQQAQAKAQNQEPTAEMLIGQAELIKAKNEEQRTQVDVADKTAKTQIAVNKEKREDFKAQSSARNDTAKLAQDQQENQFERFLQMQQQQLAENQAIMGNIKILADAMKSLQDAAQGPIVGPGFIDNVREQSALVGQAQDEAF